MIARFVRLLAVAAPAFLFAACATGEQPIGTSGAGGSSPSTDAGDASVDGSGGTTPVAEAGDESDAFTPFDVKSDQNPWDPDAACAAAVQEAETIQLPVDIIWLVDNSASMKPAIDQVTAGLNDFAALIAASSVDYRVIMLSLRSKTNPVTINGGTRYGVCIPEPLAGDADCGNGPRYFQSSIDIKSTQPLEQFLGTLDQTAGYAEGEDRGGEPWAQWMRPEATKSIVVLSDDNSRLVADDFENFVGGKNPFNSNTLPPGILDSSRNGLFDGYLFHGLYGWGEDTYPAVEQPCTYADQTQPPSSGRTYTELVKRTGGVRAQICDVAASWNAFFEGVAQAVISTSKLDCEFEIPQPDGGSVDPALVNVRLVGDSGDTQLSNVAGVDECDQDGGWYYDDPVAPSKVILCPASCDEAQEQVGPGKDGRIEVLFGCETVVK